MYIYIHCKKAVLISTYESVCVHVYTCTQTQMHVIKSHTHTHTHTKSHTTKLAHTQQLYSMYTGHLHVVYNTVICVWNVCYAVDYYSKYVDYLPYYNVWYIICTYIHCYKSYHSSDTVQSNTDIHVWERCHVYTVHVKHLWYVTLEHAKQNTSCCMNHTSFTYIACTMYIA